MASASVRLLTQGWTGDMRRALMEALTDEQLRTVLARIESGRVERKFEREEATEAVAFARSRGAHGSGWGIPEYVCAVAFGRDPEFRETWQRIRRGGEAAGS